MKLRYLKIGLCGFFFVCSWHVSASIISYNGYTLNGNVVSDGELEWLQWSETAGNSIESALANPFYGGWELASNTQMYELFTAFGFNANPNENESANTYSASTIDLDESPEDYFIQLFGGTHGINTNPLYGEGIDALMFTRAYFGRDLDNDGLYNLASVTSDYTINFTDHTSRNGYNANKYLDFSPDTESFHTYGVALVRSLRPVSVPEPSTIAIFTLGMIGLASRRLKKQ